MDHHFLTDINIKHGLKQKLFLLVPAMTTLILFPIVTSHTAEFPDPLQNRYCNRELIYWNIRQVTISPIFDEPETTVVQFYFQKPHRLYIEAPGRYVLAEGDTIWTYLIDHKQIQKNIDGYVFNPFDFIDSAQTFYRVIFADSQKIDLKSVDESTEPDSLAIYFNKDGAISRVEHLDINDNRVMYEILEELFTKKIPDDNFLSNTPKGVEIIDISD